MPLVTARIDKLLLSSGIFCCASQQVCKFDERLRPLHYNISIMAHHLLVQRHVSWQRHYSVLLLAGAQFFKTFQSMNLVMAKLLT